MSKDQHLFQETTTNPLNLCLICYDHYTPFLTSDSCCGHSFCKSCTEAYILNQLDSNKVTKIKCPSYDCPVYLSSTYILSFLAVPDAERFQRLILEKTLNRDLLNKFCPRTGCTKKINTSCNVLVCECGTRVCPTCGDFFHQGKSCLEAIDLKFEAFAKENQVRFCIICKSQIQRNRGCDHIICPVCDFEFCWVCGREYTRNHRTSCRAIWCPEPPEAPKDYSFLKCLAVTVIISLIFLLSKGLSFFGEEIWIGLLIFDTVMCLCNQLGIVCIVSGMIFSLRVIAFVSNCVGWGFMITVSFIGLSSIIRHYHILEKKKRWRSSSIEELKFVTRVFNAK